MAKIQTVFTVLILGIFLAGVPLSADVIQLKNGKTVKGYYVAVRGPFTLIRTPKGKIEKIRSTTIKGIQIDYTGIPVCYKLKEGAKKQECGGNLHSLSARRAVLLFKGETPAVRKIPLKNVVLLKFTKRARSQQVINHLHTGLTIQLKLFDKNLVGTILSRGKGLLTVELEGGEKKEIKESEIKGGGLDRRLISMMYKPKTAPVAKKSGFRFWYVFPGAPQIVRGDKWRGFAIIGGFLALAGGGAAEYSAAVSAADAAGNEFGHVYLGLSANLGSFKQHQANQRGIGGAAFLLYVYHIFDAIYFDKSRSNFRSKPAGKGPVLSWDVRTYYKHDEVRNEFALNFRF